MGGRRVAWALGVSSLVIGVALDASAVTEPVVFAPREYDRTAGAPNTFSETFSVCATAGPFRLRVQNGPGATAPVSSGSVTVNGAEVAHEADLNPQMRLLERPVSLQRENRLVVRLAGKPGGASVFYGDHSYRQFNSTSFLVQNPPTGTLVEFDPPADLATLFGYTYRNPPSNPRPLTALDGPKTLAGIGAVRLLGVRLTGETPDPGLPELLYGEGFPFGTRTGWCTVSAVIEFPE